VGQPRAQTCDLLLVARRKYPRFSPPRQDDESYKRRPLTVEIPGNHQIAAALNTKPKYLASTTLTDPRWANTTVLSGDLAAAIGELKAKPRG
jgi:hypothetical protein